MAEGLRDKVAIVGMGAIRSGDLWHMDAEDMLLNAATEAMEDAGIVTRDLQAGWLGLYYSGSGDTLAWALKTGGRIGVTKLESCDPGADAFRNAALAVASGTFDIVIAAGCEKLRDQGIAGQPVGGGLKTTGTELEGSPAGLAAPFAVRYMHKYGYSYDELKRALGHIAIKNHLNGARNPKAYFQKAITWEDYASAPTIAWPLGQYDCCANVDGAAAAILTTPQIARGLKDNFVVIKGIGAITSDGTQDVSSRSDHASLPMSRRVAQMAYAMAAINNPVEDLDVVSVHDAFTILELLNYEALGLCPEGQAPKYVETGLFDFEGKLPVNTDGGLNCFGHPVGATGLLTFLEPYLQLSGKAGPRQLKNVRLAAGQSQGGASAHCSSMVVLGGRD